ncbi:4'-phosphopantetheinyl transferase superfamily protein, partial [Klebsiella michiganensis]
KSLLDASGLPSALALTLAFSAKESAFKASPPEIQNGVGFSDFEVTYIKEGNLLLRISAGEYRLQWIKAGDYVITLCAT